MAGPMDFLRNNNTALTQLGLGLLSGQNAQQQAALGAQGLAGAMNQNRTMQYLEKTNPRLAAEVRAGRPMASAWEEIMTQRTQAAQPRNNFMAAGGSIFNTDSGEWLSPPQGAGTDAEFGLSPVYGTDAQGNPVIGQLSKSGTFQQTALPEGFKLSTGTGTVDLGTSVGTIDRRTGQLVAETPKDLAGAARETNLGKTQAEAIANLPSAIQGADYGIKLIDEMIRHPGRQTATGASSTWDPRNYMAGTDATNFQVRARQIEGQAFLEAFDSLKGAGQITEVEGQKATQAKARLDRAQSDEEYVGALNELKQILEIGKQRAIKRAQGGAAPAVAPQPGQRLRFNPATGELE